MLAEPVDGLTEMLPAIVAEVIPELGLGVDEHDASRVYSLARTDPAAPADVHDNGFPFQILMTRMELSSSPAPTLSIARAADITVPEGYGIPYVATATPPSLAATRTIRPLWLSVGFVPLHSYSP